uniref:RNA-directed RNA polymerase n=1 Tax=Anourosorex squamipes ribovirus 2 TaxID=3139460 RepID=A0AB38ZJL1_9VIRU
MFVKIDKMNMITVESKPPRAIQFRSPQFNLMFSRYIKKFEHVYYPKLTYGSVSKTRVVAKGLNAVERAAILIQKSEYFASPKYLLFDHSAFDSSITVAHLKATHKKYNKVFNSRELAKLCSYQIDNRGMSRNGIEYRVRGTRMSGDADTALGNTLVNLDCMYGFLKANNISKYDMLVDGDDSIVIVEQGEKFNLGFFEQFGFKTKLEVTNCLERAEFCQSRVVLTDPPTFVRNPCRAISHASIAVDMETNDIPGWLEAVALCEISCNSGVPVLQTFAESLRTGYNPKFTPDMCHRMALETFRNAKPITDKARASFSRAWGIDPQLQRELEDTCTSYRVLNCLQSENASEQTRTRSRRVERSSQRRSSAWWCGCEERDQQSGELFVPACCDGQPIQHERDAPSLTPSNA